MPKKSYHYNVEGFGLMWHTGDNAVRKEKEPLTHHRQRQGDTSVLQISTGLL